MNDHLAELSGYPLDQLLAKALDRLRGATLDELGVLLGRASSASGSRASSSKSASPASTEGLARAILALPGSGSKLGAAERAVVLHALDVSNGNVSAAARLLGIDRKALERKVRRIRRSR